MTATGDHAWLQPLLERYRQQAEHGATDSQVDAPSSLSPLDGLWLADALLRRETEPLAFESPVSARERASVTAGDHAARGCHLAVLGPTQTGKSSMVNLLLGRELADISALAGHTVHAEGFATAPRVPMSAVESVMRPLERVSRMALDPERLDVFSLESIEAPDALLDSPAIVWDTPDIDSIRARHYQIGIYKAIALSDLLVLVLSRDKYADRRVWELLSWLTDLARPLIVCLNKLDSGREQEVLDSFKSRWEEELGTALPAVIGLPWLAPRSTAASLAQDAVIGSKDGKTRPGDPGDRATRDQTTSLSLERLPERCGQLLIETLQKAEQTADDKAREAALARFISRHRDYWLQPVRAELAARDDWNSCVEAALAEAERVYVRDYLENPDKYDTFNRALAELLTLLEIPGIARALARTRELVTWPARRLLGIGRAAVGERAASSAPDHEQDILERLVDRLLVRLNGELAERAAINERQDHWWSAVATAFREQRDAIRQDTLAASLDVRREFEPRIEAAAQRLHARLQSQPAVLNTLRAARASGDAAGVALAVKSGGLAPADLILAPAMLSVTSLLTESALGRYLDRIKRELQSEQRAVFRRRLLDETLGQRLMQLTEQLAPDTHFTGQLDSRVIEAATLGDTAR